MPTIIQGVAGAKALVGQTLGSSEWVTIDQDRINQFADVTGDHQWIHVDVERAKAGPFGAPIAHGFLTLSLVVALNQQIVRYEGFTAGINYGLNKVRFLTPVKVGSRVRSTLTMQSIEDKPMGILITNAAVIEIEGAPKPACTIEQLSLLIPA